ncbi:hypothetical protein [uncultured Polaribacter sp.]|uniref:hypothetical protein n=1 Tax=uncultured Polaribacter sp. TaxID=174711 RepID=UPI002620455A|nr:hypothetical protein [uncultured Polaribacter sp.]
MNIKSELEKIWNNDNSNELPEFVKERGFVFAENEKQKDILITGINPSFREGDPKKGFGFDFQKTLFNEKYDNYWGPIKKMLLNENIDLRKNSAYLDILYYRERIQPTLKNEFLKTKVGIEFIAKQISLSQRVIERIIKPKVIIVKNKESQAYWGKYSNKGTFWMGYEFEFIENLYCGELYKIKKLIKTNKRVTNEIEETNLENTLVLFSHHINQYTSKEKRLRTETIMEFIKNIIPAHNN